MYQIMPVSPQQEYPVAQHVYHDLPVQPEMPPKTDVITLRKPGIHHDNTTRTGIHYRRGPYRHDYSEAAQPKSVKTNLTDVIPSLVKPGKKRRLHYGEAYAKLLPKGIQYDNGTQRYNTSDTTAQTVKEAVAYTETQPAPSLPYQPGPVVPAIWPAKSSKIVHYDNGSSVEEDYTPIVKATPYTPRTADYFSYMTGSPQGKGIRFDDKKGIKYDSGRYRTNYSEADVFVSPYTLPAQFIPTVSQQKRDGSADQMFFPVTRPYVPQVHFENETSVDEVTPATRTTISYGTSRRMRYDDKDRPNEDLSEPSAATTIQRTVPPSFIPKVRYNYTSMINETRESVYPQVKPGIRFDNYSKVEEEERDDRASTLIVPLIATKQGSLRKVRFNGTTGITKMLSGKRYQNKADRTAVYSEATAPNRRHQRLKYDNISTPEMRIVQKPQQLIKPVHFDNETSEDKDIVTYTKVPTSALRGLHYNSSDPQDAYGITTLGVESSQIAPIVVRKFRQNDTTSVDKSAQIKFRLKYNETTMDDQDIPESTRSVYQPRQKLMSIRMRYENDSADVSDVEPIRLVRLTTQANQTLGQASPTWIFLNGTIPGNLRSVGAPVTFVEKPMGRPKILPVRLKENVSEVDNHYEERQLLQSSYQNTSQSDTAYNAGTRLNYDNATGIDRLKYEEYESTTVMKVLMPSTSTMMSVGMDNSTRGIHFGSDYIDEEEPRIVYQQIVQPTMAVKGQPGIGIEDLDLGDDAMEEPYMKQYFVPMPSQPVLPAPSQAPPQPMPQIEMEPLHHESIQLKHVEKDPAYTGYVPPSEAPVHPTPVADVYPSPTIADISLPVVPVSPVQGYKPEMPLRNLLGWERSASGRSFVRRYNGSTIDELYAQPTVQMRPSAPVSQMVPQPMQYLTGWERAAANQAFDERYNTTAMPGPDAAVQLHPSAPVQPILPQPVWHLTGWERAVANQVFDERYNTTVLPVSKGQFPGSIAIPQHYNSTTIYQPPAVSAPIQPMVPQSVQYLTGWERAAANQAFDERYNATALRGPDATVQLRPSTPLQPMVPQPIRYLTGWERAAANQVFDERYNTTVLPVSEGQFPGSIAIPQQYNRTTIYQPPTVSAPIQPMVPQSVQYLTGWERAAANQAFDERYNATALRGPDGHLPGAVIIPRHYDGTIHDVQPTVSVPVPPVMPQPVQYLTGWERAAPNQAYDERYNTTALPISDGHSPGMITIPHHYNRSVFGPDAQPAVQLRPLAPERGTAPQPMPSLTGWERAAANQAFDERYNASALPLPDRQFPGFVAPVMNVVPLVPSKTPFAGRLDAGWDTDHPMFPERYNLTIDDYSDISVVPAFSVPVPASQTSYQPRFNGSLSEIPIYQIPVDTEVQRHTVDVAAVPDVVQPEPVELRSPSNVADRPPNSQSAIHQCLDHSPLQSG
ncbi:uncharacterized protein LOC129584124 [Paramacrobiotus metropolitanus]|uniref:uncharacterized protein LOC129584124 n=1 Tax=Paramacrobiotus metropolitanus TaxID=2943436 RepID=UPI002445E574|nr:uncharacterized protein LOC129584124 [Paramacrobiotus metropolitanus]